MFLTLIACLWFRWFIHLVQDIVLYLTIYNITFFRALWWFFSHHVVCKTFTTRKSMQWNLLLSLSFLRMLGVKLEKVHCWHVSQIAGSDYAGRRCASLEGVMLLITSAVQLFPNLPQIRSLASTTVTLRNRLGWHYNKIALSTLNRMDLNS